MRYSRESRKVGDAGERAVVGQRTGVADAHPHRFRDTFCVDLLARCVNPYNVARLMGITVEMLEKHYAPFVPELRDRVRTALESGLESIQSAARATTGEQGKIQ
jgi:hypothetical protein